jgi:hypothetical protein
MSTFDLDKKSIKALKKFYRQAPRKFAAASGMLLNNLAFGVKKQIPITMRDSGMVIRNERFVNSKIRVEKSRFSLPIDAQRSTVGSVSGPRFTGWIEQETGEQPDRSRVFHLAARAGSKKKKAPPRFRLRASNNPPRPNQYKGKDANHRVVVMLQMLGREGYKKPFVITGHKRMRSGLYKFGRGGKGKKRLVMLQRFDKPPTPKKFPWIRKARRDYMASISLIAEWKKAIERSLRPPTNLK